MNFSQLAKVLVVSLLMLRAVPFSLAQQSSEQPNQDTRFPYASKLTYDVTWRMLSAGEAWVNLTAANSGSWNLNLDLRSAGVVSRLYRVLDAYKASMNSGFCGQNAVLDAQEGKKHTLSRLMFDNTRHKVIFDERDLNKNTTEKKELDIAPCTYEITGALANLRTFNLPPGKSASLPITDGKKVAYARVESQARENLTVAGKSYSTVRYEAFLFDNVLYKRKGRLFIWMTDDPQRLPVQFRLQMGFPIGNIMVQLEKEEKL